MFRVFMLVVALAFILSCGGDVASNAMNGNTGSSTRQLLDTVYVDGSIDNGGNGTSWTKAFKTLQAGIDAAAQKASDSGRSVRVHVAVGIYKPTSRPNPGVNPRNARTMHFSLKNNVEVYGGYPSRGSANQKATILTGDLGDKRVYHVFYHPETVKLNSTAKLENVTITKGNANGTAQDNKGGGMYNENSSPTLKNVIFNGNTATRGGGMYNIENSNPTLTDCIFTGNTATEYGGGMYNRKSSPKLIVHNSERTSFAHNTAKSGGGIYNTGSSPTLNGVTFQSNEATEYGGGIANFHNSNPKLDIYCRFKEAELGAKQNTADIAGGGMYADSSSNPDTSLDSGNIEASKENGYYQEP